MKFAFTCKRKTEIFTETFQEDTWDFILLINYFLTISVLEGRVKILNWLQQVRIAESQLKCVTQAVGKSSNMLKFNIHWISLILMHLNDNRSKEEIRVDHGDVEDKKRLPKTLNIYLNTK